MRGDGAAGRRPAKPAPGPPPTPRQTRYLNARLKERGMGKRHLEALAQGIAGVSVDRLTEHTMKAVIDAVESSSDPTALAQRLLGQIDLPGCEPGVLGDVQPTLRAQPAPTSMLEGTMLVVQLEVWPGGDPTRRRTLGTARIGRADDGPEDAERGTYRAVVRGEDQLPVGPKVIVVESFPRRTGAWALVRRVLGLALGPEGGA